MLIEDLYSIILLTPVTDNKNNIIQTNAFPSIITVEPCYVQISKFNKFLCMHIRSSDWIFFQCHYFYFRRVFCKQYFHLHYIQTKAFHAIGRSWWKFYSVRVPSSLLQKDITQDSAAVPSVSILWAWYMFVMHPIHDFYLQWTNVGNGGVHKETANRNKCHNHMKRNTYTTSCFLPLCKLLATENI